VNAVAFHAPTLTYWRRRLAASTDPNRIFTAAQQVIAQTGALKERTRRALDSTVLDDAVATPDTVTQLIAAVRRVRRYGLLVLERGPRPLVVHAARRAALCNMMRLS